MCIRDSQYPYEVTGGGYYGAARLAKGSKHDLNFVKFEEVYKDECGRKELVEYVYSLIMERGGPQYFSIIKSSRKNLLGLFLPEALSQLEGSVTNYEIPPNAFGPDSASPSYTFADLIVDEIYSSKGCLLYTSMASSRLNTFISLT